jgi:hypothetical protein
VATKKTGIFAYDHPALVATLAAIAIGGGFLYALKLSAGDHSAPGAHGSAAPHSSASGAPAASAKAPAKQ